MRIRLKKRRHTPPIPPSGMGKDKVKQKTKKRDGNY